jgi:hypothetical protein
VLRYFYDSYRRGNPLRLADRTPVKKSDMATGC